MASKERVGDPWAVTLDVSISRETRYLEISLADGSCEIRRECDAWPKDSPAIAANNAKQKNIADGPIF